MTAHGSQCPQATARPACGTVPGLTRDGGRASRPPGPAPCPVCAPQAAREECPQLRDPFEQLRATAVTTLGRHVPGPDRRCQGCCAAWPCEAACLAEFSLGVL